MAAVVKPEQQSQEPASSARVLYYIAKRESIMKLPWWKRWLVRRVNSNAHWASDYSNMSMGIFDDRKQAEASADARSRSSGDLWYVKDLPLNALLPDEPCAFGKYTLHSHPESDAAVKYANRTFDTLKISDAQTLAREAKVLHGILKPKTS